MANFAKAQLLKYGWTEGKGLGKKENGITEALKPKLKFNTEGLGHKLEEIQWWESTFNNAAKNVSISSKNDEVSISVIEKNIPSTITKKNLKENQSRQEQYNNFRKTCLLQDEKLVTFKNAHEKEDDTTVNNISLLTDDELFKACGGRTAHKGARHGLGLSGKLERIARQEMKLLGLMSNVTNKEITNNFTSKTRDDVVKKNSEMDNNASATLTAIGPSCDEVDGFIKSKATLKKEKRKMRNLSHLLSTSCNIDENNSNSTATINGRSNLKRKRSKDRKKNVDIDININSDVLATVTLEKDHNMSLSTNPVSERKNKKHKKHNKHSTVKEDNNINLYDCETSSHDSKRKGSSKLKKKKKQSQETGEVSAEITDDSALKILEHQKRKIVKLMGKMNFGNSEDVHIKKDEKDSSITDIMKLENTFSSQEARRLNRQITKKKKYRLHKKYKEKANLERHMVTVCSQRNLDDLTENLMSVDIADDVSAILKGSKQKSNKQMKLKRKTDSSKNDTENRTNI